MKKQESKDPTALVIEVHTTLGVAVFWVAFAVIVAFTLGAALHRNCAWLCH